jgi:hypothetical protein
VSAIASRRRPWRREPLSLPYLDQVPQLVRFLDERPDRDGGHAQPIAPQRLVDAAAYHYVAGYVIRAVRSERLELPAVERERLVAAANGSVVQAAVLRSELGNVSEVVADVCGTPPLLLKGPALADRFYPDRGLRPYTDLDLLVPRSKLGAAARALAAHGYETLEEFRPGYAERYGHDLHVRRRLPNRTVDIELHWRIGDDPLGVGLSHERLAPDAEIVEIGGAPIAVPAPPAHLLVLALHLLSDRKKRLCWINDVALVAASLDDLSWSEAFALAAELELVWPLHRSLDYAEYHLGFARERAGPNAAPPRWGPVRAVEELSLRASPHIGRLAAMGWRERLAFMRGVLLPTRAGLAGTVGHDGAPTWRLVARHIRKTIAGLTPRREPDP